MFNNLFTMGTIIKDTPLLQVSAKAASVQSPVERGNFRR